MASKTYAYSGMRYLQNPVWFGADPTGAADSLGAINEAIRLCSPGGTVQLPAGRFNCVQDSTTSIAQAIRMKSGVKLVGAGKGETYLIGNFPASPLVVATRVSDWALTDMTILHGGYRTGLTFPTAEGWKVAGPTNYNTAARYNKWDVFYDALWVSTGDYLSTRDHDTMVFIGGTKTCLIENVDFDSEWTDERGWIDRAITCHICEDETKCSGVTVRGCDFYKTRQGFLCGSIDDHLFENCRRMSTWSYAGAPAGHLWYYSGSASGFQTSAEGTLGSNVTVRGCSDPCVWLDCVYSAPPDYYGDVTLKARKIDGLTVTDCHCVSAQAGFNWYDIKNGSMTDCYFDASTCPDDPGRTWGSSAEFFMLANTKVPATGYTASDYILGPMDVENVTIITPYQAVGDATWSRWFIFAPYKTSGGTQCASLGDSWKDVTIYLAPNPSAAAGVTQNNRWIGTNATIGTAQQPVRFFPHPLSPVWGSDQRILEQDNLGSTGNTFVIEVQAQTGQYVAGHPPAAHSSATGSNTLNSQAFNSGANITFSGTIASDPPSVPV